MQLSKLVTYSFDPNVGPFDRVFRVVSGAALAALPWVSGLVPSPVVGGVVTAFGLAWLMTGLVSRCGTYYLLGVSTRSGEN